MAEHLAEGVALGLRYDIFDRTGKVSHSETRSETEVQGNISGGGGYTSGGSGYQAPVSGNVTSKTTRYQTIFLTDSEGREHTIELQDFLVPCKPDHKLTMLLLTAAGNDKGSYFMAYNHNTRETYQHPKAIRSEMFPTKIVSIVLAVSFLLLFFNRIGEMDTTFLGTVFNSAFVTLLIGIPVWIVGAAVGFYRSMIVKRDMKLKEFLSVVS